MARSWQSLARGSFLCTLAAVFGMTTRSLAGETLPQVIESSDIAPVVSEFPVNFRLETRGDEQFVAFYDARRAMTLAKRKLTDSAWQVVPVPNDQPSVFGAKATSTRVGWDSHNSINFAFDDDGQIHLTGNMHNNPLLYFRTQRPGDIASFRRLDRMTGDRELQVTYPRFVRRPGGALIFIYRDGVCGNGADFYNAFDPADRTWKRLLDTPVTDGRADPTSDDSTYAYAHGPLVGPDGWYHQVWIWRDTGDCSTNHTLSYGRSKDLVQWQRSDGTPFKLPITPQTSEVVDPVPVKGGMINGNAKIGFDALQRVIITYHKFDAQGNTQIYNARRENDGWKIVQASRWKYRWDFSGLGTMIFEVGLSAVEVAPDGRLRQTWNNKQDGAGGTYLDPQTLEPTESYKAPLRWPKEVSQPQSSFPGMKVHLLPDTAGPQPDGSTYVLRWETLASNNDHPRQGPLPEPTMLRVLKIGPAKPAELNKP